jgi:hypothetical protein
MLVLPPQGIKDLHCWFKKGLKEQVNSKRKLLPVSNGEKVSHCDKFANLEVVSFGGEVLMQSKEPSGIAILTTTANCT